MQFLRIVSMPAIFGLAVILALAPQMAVAQSCCNAALPACPTPPIKFGVGPACCPGDEARCST